MTEVTPRNQDAPVEAAADVATMTTPAEGGGTETKKEETKEDKPEGSTTTGSTTEETPSALKENDSTSGPPPEAEKPVVVVEEAPKAAPVVSANKRSRPAYKYDPNKITLRFLFANRDGLTVTVECKPLDTVSEVKGALLSVWPEDLPRCSGGDRLRLICMGKGMLMPDTRTLEDCQVPVFKTHPTPINVSVRPETVETGHSKSGGDGKTGRGGGGGGGTSSGGGAGGGGAGPAASRNSPGGSGATDQGCACIIL